MNSAAAADELAAQARWRFSADLDADTLLQSGVALSIGVTPAALPRWRFALEALAMRRFDSGLVPGSQIRRSRGGVPHALRDRARDSGVSPRTPAWRTGCKLLCAEEDPMLEAPIPIIAAYDFSPSSEQALSRAIEVAARAPQHVLHIVAALDPHDRGPLGRTSYQTADEVQRLIVDKVVEAFAGRETASEVQFFVHARIGNPAAEILAVAAAVGADLIFIGSHGKTGVERLLLGSVSERIVREAKCPVMVVRPKTYADIELLQVTRYEHERAPHREPHCYTYSNRQVILRPADWPLA